MFALSTEAQGLGGKIDGHRRMTNLDDRFRAGVGRRREASTVAQYSQELRRFVIASGKTSEWGREDFLSYFDNMIDSNYAPASLLQKFHALKKIFEVLGEPFAMKLSDLPKGTGDQNQPVIAPDTVKAMIRAVKNDGNNLEKFYLSMSTVYGIRREELSRLTSKNFDFVNEKVDLPRVKHNIKRAYILPSQLPQWLQPAIRKHQVPNSKGTVSAIWHDICYRTGYKPSHRESWHSVRRCLDTMLIDAGVPEAVISNFMGWSVSSIMVRRYYQASVQNVDAQVFKVHPFVGEWQ